MDAGDDELNRSRRCGRGFRQRRQNLLQFGRIDGLHQMGAEAGFGAAAAVFILAPAGLSHQNGAFSLGHFPNAAADFVAIHARQAEIEQHDLGPKCLGHLQSGGPSIAVRTSSPDIRSSIARLVKES